MGKVAINQLKEGMISDQTIYNDQGLILVASGVTLTNFIINQLQKLDITNVKVKDEAEAACENTLTQNPRTYPVAVRKVIAAVKDITDDILDYRAISIKNNISAIEDIISAALEKPFVQEFMANCAVDEILFKHSIRTAILSTNMGLIKKYTVPNLEKLAISTLLHDCGMENKFNDTDLEHPFLGFEKLRKNPDIDMLTALVCLQHHEHYDGSGFPFSFSRTQIAEFAALVAVADYYDRLLINGEEPRKAMFKTIEKKNKLFNPNMTEMFGATIDWSRIYSISTDSP